MGSVPDPKNQLYQIFILGDPLRALPEFKDQLYNKFEKLFDHKYYF